MVHSGAVFGNAKQNLHLYLHVHAGVCAEVGEEPCKGSRLHITEVCCIWAIWHGNVLVARMVVWMHRSQNPTQYTEPVVCRQANTLVWLPTGVSACHDPVVWSRRAERAHRIPPGHAAQEEMEVMETFWDGTKMLNELQGRGVMDRCTCAPAASAGALTAEQRDEIKGTGLFLFSWLF